MERYAKLEITNRGVKRRGSIFEKKGAEMDKATNSILSIISILATICCERVNSPMGVTEPELVLVKVT